MLTARLQGGGDTQSPVLSCSLTVFPFKMRSCTLLWQCWPPILSVSQWLSLPTFLSANCLASKFSEKIRCSTWFPLTSLLQWGMPPSYPTTSTFSSHLWKSQRENERSPQGPLLPWEGSSPPCAGPLPSQPRSNPSLPVLSWLRSASVKRCNSFNSEKGREIFVSGPCF